MSTATVPWLTLPDGRSLTEAEIAEHRGLHRMSELDGLASRVVAQFQERSKTKEGTPLFGRIGPTADMLRELVRDALQEVAP